MFRVINKPELEEQSADRLFAVPQSAHDFKFSAETASVFDDMVSRSVPYYDEIQRMVCELAEGFAVSGTNLYDIGCATGTTLFQLNNLLDKNVQLIGLDNSDEMLEKANVKFTNLPHKDRINLINADLNDPPELKNSSVVILLLTLQFVRPLNREKLIRKIYNGLNENGCLILVEKVTGSCTLLNRIFIEYYYNYKRRMGYSNLEISQKREALENVLIPYHHEENRKLLLDNGFSHVDEFFRWYNFSGVIAVK
jgi:tRNA (cmo5U34)-methyltransferase